MIDILSRAERSARMSLVKGKNTKPELRARRIVSSLGLRYRLHGTKLPGRPDMVFSSQNKVIFIHGCFWHRHPGCTCARLPKSKLGFWKPKLLGNRRRDFRNQAALRKLGWGYLVIWECELGRPAEVVERVAAFMAAR